MKVEIPRTAEMLNLEIVSRVDGKEKITAILVLVLSCDSSSLWSSVCLN